MHGSPSCEQLSAARGVDHNTSATPMALARTALAPSSLNHAVVAGKSTTGIDVTNIIKVFQLGFLTGQISLDGVRIEEFV